jgi:hypothetical protein
LGRGDGQVGNKRWPVISWVKKCRWRMYIQCIWWGWHIEGAYNERKVIKKVSMGPWYQGGRMWLTWLYYSTKCSRKWSTLTGESKTRSGTPKNPVEWAELKGWRLGGSPTYYTFYTLLITTGPSK